MNAAEIHSQPQHPTLTPMKASEHRSTRHTTSPQPHNSSQKKLDSSTDPSSNMTFNRTRQTTVSALQSPVYSFYLSIVSAPFRMYLQIFWFPQSSLWYSGMATEGLQSRQRFAAITRKRFAFNSTAASDDVTYLFQLITQRTVSKNVCSASSWTFHVKPDGPCELWCPSRVVRHTMLTSSNTLRQAVIDRARLEWRGSTRAWYHKRKVFHS